MDRETSTVKWFDEKKGFGFIANPKGGKDIFVHYSEIRGDGFKTLQEGDTVDYVLESNNKGVKATDVVRV